MNQKLQQDYELENDHWNAAILKINVSIEKFPYNNSKRK